MATEEVLRRIPQMPESVQRILAALDGAEPKTMQQLREESGLARRTVYGAIRRLMDMGLVKQQISLHDSRQSYFWLASCRL